jgi:hypothetical protein
VCPFYFVSFDLSLLGTDGSLLSLNFSNIILIFDNHIGEHILKQTFVRSVDGTLHEVIGHFILFIFR